MQAVKRCGNAVCSGMQREGTYTRNAARNAQERNGSQFMRRHNPKQNGKLVEKGVVDA